MTQNWHFFEITNSIMNVIPDHIFFLTPFSIKMPNAQGAPDFACLTEH